MKTAAIVGVALLAVFAAAAAAVQASLGRALAHAAALARQGSTVLQTACGPIEVQQAGVGVPLLMVHGSGGGHDQGMAFARPLIEQGVRVIAVSRFGYLQTPRPADATPEAQADAHACVLDALGIEHAAVLGLSAGGPSALQAALRHPQRFVALVLVVPITPPTTDSPRAPAPVSDEKDAWLERLLGSDFLVWSALKLARGPFFRHVLATPPELVAAASAEERARADTLAEHVLPVSARAAGLVDDTRLGKSLKPYPLQRIRAPTLAISARDDGFGTFDGAAAVVAQIEGARFIGYEQGGHLLIGHNREALAEIASFLHGAMPAPTTRGPK